MSAAPRSELFARRLESDPENTLFRFSYGQALLEEGDTAGAFEALRRCCAARGDWMVARILLGKALLNQGDRSAAKSVFEDALDLAYEQDHEGPRDELLALLEDLG